MKRMTVALCAAFSLTAAAADNVAYSDDNVRFTVVADGVVRMEYAPDGRFTDEPSLLAIERDYAPADYRVSERGRNVSITTRKMRVDYRKGSGPFTADNLRVRSGRDISPAFDWRPGMQQTGNLKGTTRTLDGLDGDVQTQDWVADMKPGERRVLDDGLIATDGWTLLDDSDGYIFDSKGNAAERRGADGAQDWYFMAYGHDYKTALRDYTTFAGRVPLPPRFTFGYWWSRYWAYSDAELRALTDKFAAYDIPLDVLVVDMDWHYTDPGRGGWTGWTWNRSLFPDPEGFMAHMHEKNVKVTLNLHPADGFEPYEKCYPALASALGRDDNKKIDWVGSDPQFMKAVFDSVLHPMERAGVDFWWLDWQQHLNDPVLTRLNNTWWINHCFFSDMQRQGGRRPLLYHRWGGLGNHRYQVGFSGDAVISWKSLEYQPYFTSTASNVLYGYWSHDLGGHLGSEKIDPEMYTRWLQYGAFSPVMRTHSSKSPELNKEPWVFDDEYRDAIRAAVLWRYAMVPYIYTMARKTYDEGVSLSRPMYYDYPEAPEAYEHRSQYMFGDDMLIAPVTSPADSSGYATATVWLPAGSDWYELHTGTLLTGGQTLARRFALDEYGVYVRAGAILPYYAASVRRLEGNDAPIDIVVYPGAGTDSFDLYEDAGNDCGYAENYAVTPLSVERADGSVTVKIGARRGSYEGMPARRTYSLRLPASAAPESVTIDGNTASWSYDGSEFAVVVPLGDIDCAVHHEAVLRYSPGAATLPTDGLIGRARRMAKAVNYIKFHGCDTHADELATLGTVSQAATYAPERLDETVATFGRLYSDLPGVLARQGMPQAVRTLFMNRIDYVGTARQK